MDLSIDDATKVLIERQKELTTVLSERRREDKEIEKELKKVTAAVKVLLGDKAKGEFADKQLVIKFATKLLQDNGPIERSTLKELVETKVKERGMPASVVGLLMKHAMKEPRFVVSPDGIVSLESSYSTSS